MTVYSALAPGFTDAAAVVSQIKKETKDFIDNHIPSDVKVDFTGQIEEQAKQNT